VHKSAYFEVCESKLSDITTRIEMLDGLRTGVGLADLAGFDSTNLGTKPDPATGYGGSGDRQDKELRIKHMNEDWFGMQQNPSKKWRKRSAPRTGFWSDYKGDPESILRDGMTRAIEVSLGIPPGEEPDICCLERRWPIDIYWLCQGPWFQCWVLWRESDTTASEGHVTLLITTPAATGFPLTPKITRPLVINDPPYTDPEYASPPPAGARRNRRGMWVVGHEDYRKRVVCSTGGSGQGEIIMPGIRWQAAGDVVCVAPAEWEAGVLHDGRPYMAP
jgi:hypothetical protein